MTDARTSQPLTPQATAGGSIVHHSEPFPHAADPRIVQERADMIIRNLRRLEDQQAFWDTSGTVLLVFCTALQIISTLFTFSSGVWNELKWLMFVSGAIQVVLIGLIHMQTKFRTKLRSISLKIDDILARQHIDPLSGGTAGGETSASMFDPGRRGSLWASPDDG